MSKSKSTNRSLAERIRELRRRHFGARGKAEFAQRLGVSTDEYAEFERSRLPSGEIMMRMCEVTGEDLQWLLTGVASRGTVVISGARGRHQDLLARIARDLDARPELAAPLEAFFDLLSAEPGARAGRQRRLAAPSNDDLIPLLTADDLPELLTASNASTARHPLALANPPESLEPAESATLIEPGDADSDVGSSRPLSLVAGTNTRGRTQRFVRSRELVTCFPDAFGVFVESDDMSPMIQRGDAVLVAVGAEPTSGQLALCRFRVEPRVRCRIWLGRDEERIHLGRVCDGEHEEVAAADHCWSLEVLYRIATAN